MGCHIVKNGEGFSLVELLVTMVVSAIVIGAIYLTSAYQEQSLSVEDTIAELQASLRGGVVLLEHDLRMAGYDPSCTSPPCKGFTSANVNSFTIVSKDPRNGSPVTIAYRLYDAGHDGDTDLGRNRNGSGNQPVILNVDAFNVLYFDKDGNQLAAPLGLVAQGKVAFVEIAIVAHAEKPDSNYINSSSYTNFQGMTIYTAPGDHFRRRMLRARVACRNNV